MTPFPSAGFVDKLLGDVQQMPPAPSVAAQKTAERWQTWKLCCLAAGAAQHCSSSAAAAAGVESRIRPAPERHQGTASDQEGYMQPAVPWAEPSLQGRVGVTCGAQQMPELLVCIHWLHSWTLCHLIDHVIWTKPLTKQIPCRMPRLRAFTRSQRTALPGHSRGGTVKRTPLITETNCSMSTMR